MTRLLWIAILAAAVFESACYPVKEYHMGAPVVTLPQRNIKLAYIEFDDNGEMFDRKELDQTIQTLQDLESHTPGGINVVLFIHGWKNNAGDTINVAGFQSFLAQIYDDYSHAAKGPPAPLVGVYIGWRGAEWKIAQDLTYFTRAGATLRVAGPHLEETLYRIIRTVKPQDAPASARSNLILIGHSFGGRVMERVITPYLEGLILASDGDHLQGCQTAAEKPVTGPLPDLTVLLNEAAPATDAKEFLEFLTCHVIGYQRDDPGFATRPVKYPLFLSITSDGDAATGIALPLVQTLARTQLKTRDYGAAAQPPEIPNQSTYFIHSAANIPALHSHEIRTTACLAQESEIRLAPIASKYRICEVPAQKTPGQPYWNHTPYWITKIPVEIVPDHSNIFRPQLYDFLRLFLPSTASLASPKSASRPAQRLMAR